MSLASVDSNFSLGIDVMPNLKSILLIFLHIKIFFFSQSIFAIARVKELKKTKTWTLYQNSHEYDTISVNGYEYYIGNRFDK